MNDKVQRLAEEEVDDLIGVADELISIAREADSSLGPEKIGEVTTWLSRTGQLIRKLYDSQGQHFENYLTLTNKYDFTKLHSNYYTHLCSAQGLLKAIRHELKKGLITDLKNLLQASIFADFLEMAEHLVSGGYKDAAAVMIGAVLEDS